MMGRDEGRYQGSGRYREEFETYQKIKYLVFGSCVVLIRKGKVGGMLWQSCRYLI